MPRTRIANFLIAIGVMFAVHGMATWHWGEVLQDIKTRGGIAVHGMAAVLIGIATSVALVRLLLPALRQGTRRRQWYVVICVCVMAVGASTFGFSDFNLVTMFNELRPAESLKLKSWVEPNIVPWTIATLTLWMLFIGLYLQLCWFILRAVKHQTPLWATNVLGVAALVLLAGILGYAVARVTGPVLTGIWKGNDPRTINQMFTAVGELGRYVKWDGIVIAVSGLAIACMGVLLPRVCIDGICSKCGYLVERERCPECGTLVIKSVHRESV